MGSSLTFSVFRHCLIGLLFLTGLPPWSAQGNNLVLKEPQGLAVDRSGNLFIADTKNHRVLRMDSTGTFTVIAGTGTPALNRDGSPANDEGLNNPKGLAIDETGNLFIADSGNHRIRKVDIKSHVISTVAGTGKPGFSGDGGLAIHAELNQPRSIALDKTGNLFIADTENDRIRRVDAQTGMIATVAGSGQDEGLDEEKLGDWLKFALGNPLGDGKKATKAILSEPSDVKLDVAGNLFIADDGHSRIRRVDAKSGRISKVVATGNYVAKMSEGGAKHRALGSPLALVIDKNSNLYIASSSNQIQRVDAKSKKTTVIAGDNNGNKGYGGDDGEPGKALLNSPTEVIMDAKGNLIIADTGNNRIRYVDLAKNLITTLVGR